MAKIIKLTDEYKADMLEKFKKFIEDIKMADGKVNFSDTFSIPSRKASLCFSEKAWYKMHELVSHFDKEVAWHGTARRGDDAEKDEYYIDDIFVYPQEVTGATVNTDQEKYQSWLYSLDDDTFSNLRMQGHSHVNMGTTPSGVDLTHQEKILEQLENDMFYIFLIWNKKDDRTIKIYDFAKNILFETSDIEVLVDEQDIGIITFIENADSMVSSKVYSYSSAKTETKTDKKDDKKDDIKELTSPKETKSTTEDNKRKGRRRENDDAPSYYGSYYSGRYSEDYDYGSGTYPPEW